MGEPRLHGHARRILCSLKNVLVISPQFWLDSIIHTQEVKELFSAVADITIKRAPHGFGGTMLLMREVWDSRWGMQQSISAIGGWSRKSHGGLIGTSGIIDNVVPIDGRGRVSSCVIGGGIGFVLKSGGIHAAALIGTRQVVRIRTGNGCQRRRFGGTGAVGRGPIRTQSRRATGALGSRSGRGMKGTGLCSCGLVMRVIGDLCHG